MSCRLLKSVLRSTLRSKRFTCSLPASRMSSTSSLPGDTFLEKITKLVLDECLVTCNKTNAKVVDFLHPAELQKEADLEVGKAVTDTELLDLCQKAARCSVKTNHPHFYNQLYHGVDPIGLGGAWLTDALNTNIHTFEVAPFFILTEYHILKHLRQLIGWNEGDGIFCPGGSLSNMYGMVLARYKRFPEVKTKGMASVGTLVAYTSDESHYSLIKGANWLGLGTDNIAKVPTDDMGKMRAKKLEEMVERHISEGKVPFFVNATCGSTVLGAYDPLHEIADVCEKYGLWLHVDACWGGSVLASRKLRHLMDGIERVDSVAWNPHKMIGAPLQCSAFVLREKGLLHKCNSASANYLFQQDKFYDVSYDTGDKSLQCGRKVDAFKLWLMWKAHGDSGIEAMVNNAFYCAQYLHDKLKATEGFRMVLPDISCTNVCFWYIPPSLRGQIEDDAWRNQLSQVAPKIKERMVKTGNLMIGYQPCKQHVNFFRMVIHCQPPPTTEHMDFVIREIIKLGEDL